MRISQIVAISKNRAIGHDQDIPWHLPADLKHFRRLTLDHHIVMGRKTFQSLPGVLPNRTHIVLTRQRKFRPLGVVCVGSFEEAKNLAEYSGETELFIIGGGDVYAQLLSQTKRIYLTQVDVIVEGDTFYPELPDSDWLLISEEACQPDEKNSFSYTFKVYERQVRRG